MAATAKINTTKTHKTKSNTFTSQPRSIFQYLSQNIFKLKIFLTMNILAVPRIKNIQKSFYLVVHTHA